jgi:sugar phosphate permease
MGNKENRHKVFYGWYILAIGMAGAFIGAGTSQLFMSIMLIPLTQEFEWSRTALTGAITAGTIISGILSLPVGKLADRYGPRFLTSLGALITAVSYAAFTKFADLTQFYLIYIIARAIATNTISQVVPRTAVVNWFYRFRGRALGMLAMSPALGASILAIIAEFIMQRYGWRDVFAIFAVATVLFQAIPAALILRKRPEDLGLLPDGKRKAPVSISASQHPGVKEEINWTLQDAIRTRTLWLLSVAVVFALAVAAGIGFQMAAYFTDMGIDPTAAIGAISVYALTGAVSNLIWGFLTERLSERLMAATVMVLTAIAILYLHSVRTITGAYTFAVFFGLTSRGGGVLLSIILAEYYGRSSFGAIHGFVYPFSMIGLGFGPLISSFFFDLTGSYTVVLNNF